MSSHGSGSPKRRQLPTGSGPDQPGTGRHSPASDGDRHSRRRCRPRTWSPSSATRSASADRAPARHPHGRRPRDGRSERTLSRPSAQRSFAVSSPKPSRPSFAATLKRSSLPRTRTPRELSHRSLPLLSPHLALAERCLLQAHSEDPMAHITTRDGIKLRIKDWGQGRPVVLLHGWPLSSDTFDDLAVPLANAGFRTIAYDRRGSDAPTSLRAGTLRHARRRSRASSSRLIHAARRSLASQWEAEVARYLSRYPDNTIEGMPDSSRQWSRICSARMTAGRSGSCDARADDRIDHGDRAKSGRRSSNSSTGLVSSHSR